MTIWTMALKQKAIAEAAENCSDEEWVRQTLKGQTASFERIVERYAARLIRFAYGRLRSTQDAEDICQETFLKAYQSLHTFNLRSPFKTWLFSIAYHETVSHLRKKKVPTCSNLTDIAQPMETDDPSLPALDEIWTAARTLPPDQYTLLWLKYKENLSIPEIAEISGKSRLYASVILHRARRKLADLLWPALEEESKVGSRPRANVSCSLKGESHVL